MRKSDTDFARPRNVNRANTAEEGDRAPHDPNTSSRSDSRHSAILLLSISALVLIISSFFAVQEVSLVKNWPLWIAAIFLMWAVTYITCSYIYFRSVYLFTSSIVLLMFLYHLGVTVPIGLGFFKEKSWGVFSGAVWTRSIWNEKSAWYTLLAFGCTGVGFSLCLIVSKNNKAKSKSVFKSEETFATCRWLGVGLLLVSGIMLAYTVAAIGNPLKYSRFDFFRGVGADLRGWGVFLMAFPISCIFLVIGARRSPHRYMALSFAGIAFVLVLLTGYRGVAMNAALAGAVLWVKVGRRISALLAITGFFVVLVAIAAVAELRQVHRYSDIDQKKMERAVKGADIGYSLIQMGQSGGVLGHILRLVPDKYPYRYGTSYVQAIESSIPNFGLEMGLGTRGQVKQQAIFNRSTVGSLPPDEWLSYELLGRDRFLQGHGVGFSIIGEPYLNFGFAGVVVFFLLLGYLLGKLDKCYLLQHPRVLIFATLMLPSLFTLVRNQFGVLTKTMVFLLIIVFLWNLGTNSLRTRRKGVPRPMS